MASKTRYRGVAVMTERHGRERRVDMAITTRRRDIRDRRFEVGVIERVGDSAVRFAWSGEFGHLNGDGDQVVATVGEARRRLVDGVLDRA